MILGMGKDAPARPAPQAEAEKVEKSPAQDKKAERQKRLQSAGAVPRRSGQIGYTVNALLISGEDSSEQR